MTRQEFDFEFFNTKFYGQYFTPKLTNAVIVLVHGMGEHSSRYIDFVIPKLLAHNFAIITYDQFGHGKTSGKKGHNPGYSYLLDTIDIVLEKAHTTFGDKPTYLYGHSMGGNVVINYVLRKKHTLNGVIATSPLLRLAFQPPKWKLTAGKFLQKIMPSITMPSELDSSAISRDESQVKNYNSDALNHDKISPNYSLSVFDAGEWAIQNTKKLTIPMLLAHGTGDRITDHKASEAFANASDKAEIKLFTDGYHELHNDLEKESFMQSIIDWLHKR